MLPYLAVIIAAFYLLPLVIRDTGSAMVVLLTITPLVCFITALAFGIRNGFSILYNMLVPLLFIPTIFIFYNSSAWVYTIGYGAISLVGNGLGRMSHKK